jgi:hypothetical protein
VVSAALRQRRDTAAKRVAVLRRCLAQSRQLAAAGLVRPGSVSALDRLALADQLLLRNHSQAGDLAQLLENLLDDCLGDRLPLRCLDLATHGLQLDQRLGLAEWLRLQCRVYERCRRNGFSAKETFDLVSASRTLAWLLPEVNAAGELAVAFVFALQQACPQGLAAHQGATLFEFASSAELDHWRRWPDLLAWTHDDSIALRVSGFYFQGKQFLSKPRISAHDSPQGCELELNGRRFALPRAADKLTGRLVWCSSLYFDRMLPAVWNELERPRSPHRLQQARSMSVQCPHCQQPFRAA